MNVFICIKKKLLKKKKLENPNVWNSVEPTESPGRRRKKQPSCPGQ